MSTNDPITARKPGKQRWIVPVLAITIGIAYFVVGWLGGDRTFAVFGLILMVVTAAAFVVLSRFSETVAGLMDRRDERINRIDSEATTIAGMAVLVAVFVGLFVEIAHGRDGSPYSMLGAIGGVAYIAALIFLRFRK